MTFGDSVGIWGHMGALQQADAEKIIGRALDAGINFIDTADVYADGSSETTSTGQALKNLKVPRENVWSRPRSTANPVRKRSTRAAGPGFTSSTA